MGTQYNHACALHQAGQIGNLLQVGIRSMDSSELEFMDKSKVFFAQDIHGKTEWMDASIKQMTEGCLFDHRFGRIRTRASCLPPELRNPEECSGIRR